MTEKIIGVYKITNTITGDFYIGSSKNVKKRWASHKCQSAWNKQQNNPMYLDMRKYGLDKFAFEILAEVEAEELKEKEQEFIETLKPIYNRYNAKGIDVERYKKYQKEYQEEYRKTDKSKEYQKQYQKQYQKTDKCKEYHKQYQKSDKYKEYQKQYHKEYNKEYNNQLCCYNGETLTLNALVIRFWRQGIINPTQEAKKYLIKKESKTPIEFYDVYP